MTPLIRVFDFETSGMEPPAVVIEAGTCDMWLDSMGLWNVRSPYPQLFGGIDYLSPEVRAVHHISIDEIRGLPPFCPYLFNAAAVEAGAVALAGHNIMKFDRQWLTPGLPLIDTFKVALRLWPDAPGHSNQVLRYWLEERGELRIDEHVGLPHRAPADALVTAHVLKAALATGTTAKTMTGWSKAPTLYPRCPLGKHRGKPWAEVDAGFLDWMVNKAIDLEPDIRTNAQRELDARRSAPRYEDMRRDRA